MSIFSDLKPHNKLNRNAFDATKTATYSTKNGMCRVVNVIETVPDAKYKIQLASKIMTAPMQKSNFTTIKANFETFFVPYTQLWSDFNRFYFGRGETNENMNNQATSSLPSVITPFFDWNGCAIDLIQHAFVQSYFERIRQILVQCTQAHSSSAWDYQHDEALLSSRIENYFNYQNPQDSRFITQANYYDVHGRVCVHDMVRNFDALGFGNLLPFVKTYVSAIVSRIAFNGSDPGEGGSLNDAITVLLPTSLNYLLNDIKQNISLMFQDVTESVFESDLAGLLTEIFTSVLNLQDFIDGQQFKPNPFVLMAATKIWSDYYRNSQYDTLDYSYLFNANYMHDSASHEVSLAKVFAMLKPYYHQYKKDRFTGGYPNAQFGDVAVAGLTPEYSDMVVREDTNPSVDGVLSSENGSVVVNLFNDGGLQLKNSAAVSALAVRQALALQRYKERILRAGNRQKALQVALFGVQSRYMQDLYVDLIDASDGIININPVASTTNSDEAALGELGSYAIGQVVGKEFDYDAKDFGLIITMMYIQPETKYNSYGIENYAQKTEQFDFYQPDFQNLGLAPVTTIDYNVFLYGADKTPKVLSYLSRYYDYKTSVNKAFGEFYNSNPFELAIRSTADAYNVFSHFGGAVIANLRGAKSDYVSARSVVDFSDNILRALYLSPNDLDSLFYESEDYTQASDHFDIESTFVVKAILPMSVTGLPL